MAVMVGRVGVEHEKVPLSFSIWLLAFLSVSMSAWLFFCLTVLF